MSTKGRFTLKEGLAREIHAPARRNYKRARVVIKGVLDDLYEADLVDMRRFPDRGYQFLLTVIDTGSKRGFASPLKSKSGPVVATALEKAFDHFGFNPRLLATDRGTEFYNTHVNKVLKRRNIKLYSSFNSQVKCAIVERFNRTLKTNLYRMFSIEGHRRWVDLIPDIVHTYNNTVHSSIGMKPADVSKSNESKVLAKLFPPTRARERIRPKFNVGDRVRVSKLKGLFTKGYEPNWSNEQFTVYKIRNEPVPSFYLKDTYGVPLQGRWYNEELRRTNYPDSYLIEKIIKRSKDRALVRWLGFSSKFDSWVPIKALEG